MNQTHYEPKDLFNAIYIQYCPNITYFRGKTLNKNHTKTRKIVEKTI